MSAAFGRLTLGEGGTPVIRTGRLAVGEGVLIKDETRNPTGSFKDRMSSLALAHAVGLGANRVVCASTGNAAASAAAYAATAGLPCVVVVPAATDPAKIAQAVAHGALTVSVAGNYADAYRVAARLEEAEGFVNLTTTYRNPVAVSALRAVGYEIIAQLEPVPERIYVPVGAGPLLRGLDLAFKEALEVGVVASRPRLVAVQAVGCSPIVSAFAEGSDGVSAAEDPKTVARGIADPLQGYAEEANLTLASIRSSRGHAIAVSDAEITFAADLLAATTGLSAELAGAAGLAGLLKDRRHGLGPGDGTADMVMLTGAGWKDLAGRTAPGQTVKFDPTAEPFDKIVELADSLGARRAPDPIEVV
ncbi:MAG: pyridoxal-phosphate dependent enzyme [Bifidobacteriaceae bacterium]|jgi:threonine synthase|nr:pyridoxal-phosphate dependent enzyme [Bifidobacteriaceae bacterium]